ncbi:MAG: T9SS type A sorting domain-containing protein [Saprospiraceae bacterium]|nr:T9SS type A sorting domain-containing protein [Saprospiraceae bacterium]
MDRRETRKRALSLSFNNQDEDLFGFPFFGRCYEDADFSHAASANCFVANRETTPVLPTIYPNPSTTEIFINYPKSLAITNVSIFDVAGSFIMNKEIGGYQDRLTVPVNDLQSGYYVACLTPGIRIPFIVIH